MLDIKDYPSVEAVLKYFEEISKIPRPSGITDKIADYLVGFARERGLEYIRDGHDNVIIKKPATRGHESRPTVILQGHSDMVAAVKEGAERNIARDGVEIYRDGDFIKAYNTTLGADDGIAVAYALALLDSNDIPHPNLECVFTSNEEVGLVGASALDASHLQGRIMINLDTGNESIFTVGCAGGVRVNLKLPVKRDAVCSSCYLLRVEGLLGGHSGTEIHKGRLNAIKIVGELLSVFGCIKILEIKGGEADNAIPKNAEAIFCSERPLDELIASARSVGEKYTNAEPDIKIEIKATEGSRSALSKEDSKKIVSLIVNAPTGVVKMSKEIKGLVDSSLNMGIAALDEDEFLLSFSVRSPREDEKNEIAEKLERLITELGGESHRCGNYPGWAFKSDSPLRELSVQIYKELFGKEPKILIIHAGLECGIIADKIPGLDCISIGPNSHDVHTPRESLSLPSTERVYNLIKSVLQRI